jgi:hypothetical protein
VSYNKRDRGYNGNRRGDNGDFYGRGSGHDFVDEFHEEKQRRGNKWANKQRRDKARHYEDDYSDW